MLLVRRGGKPVAYMSVRFKPSREEVVAAEALYARIDEQRRSGRQTFKLHAGYIRHVGWRDGIQRLHRMTLVQRVAASLAVLIGATLGIAFVVTRDRRYLRIAWRTAQVVVLMAVAFGLLYVFERVLLVL